MITAAQYKALNRRKAPFKPPADKIIKRKGFSGVVLTEINGLQYEEVWEDGRWLEIRIVK